MEKWSREEVSTILPGVSKLCNTQLKGPVRWKGSLLKFALDDDIESLNDFFEGQQKLVGAMLRHMIEMNAMEAVQFVEKRLSELQDEEKKLAEKRKKEQKREEEKKFFLWMWTVYAPSSLTVVDIPEFMGGETFIKQVIPSGESSPQEESPQYTQEYKEIALRLEQRSEYIRREVFLFKPEFYISGACMICLSGHQKAPFVDAVVKRNWIGKEKEKQGTTMILLKVCSDPKPAVLQLLWVIVASYDIKPGACNTHVGFVVWDEDPQGNSDTADYTLRVNKVSIQFVGGDVPQVVDEHIGSFHVVDNGKTQCKALQDFIACFPRELFYKLITVEPDSVYKYYDEPSEEDSPRSKKRLRK